MTIINIPDDEDVVIRGPCANARPAYVLRSGNGTEQFGYATRGQAEEMALAFAGHAGVRVWFAETAGTFTQLGSIAGPSRTTPHYVCALRA